MTITGAQACGHGAVAGLGLALVVEDRPAHRRLGVGQQEQAEPAGRAVLEPAQGLDVMAEQRWPGSPGWRPASRRRSATGRAGPAASKMARCRAWWASRWSQSRSGQRSGCMNSAVSGTAWAPNSLTKRARTGRRASRAGKSRSSPWYQPKYRWLSVPQAGWGRMPEWATTGPRPVGPLQGPADRAVEAGLVPAGQHLAGDQAGDRPGRQRPAPGVSVDRQRLVVAAPQGDRRMVAEQRDGLAGLGHGLAAHLPVAPLQRQVLPDQHALAIGRLVELGPGDVGVDPQQVQAGLAGQGHVAGQLVAGGLGQGPAGRAAVGALEEQALAVDGGDEVADPDLAQPGGRTRRRSLISGRRSAPVDAVGPWLGGPRWPARVSAAGLGPGAGPAVGVGSAGSSTLTSTS